MGGGGGVGGGVGGGGRERERGSLCNAPPKGPTMGNQHTEWSQLRKEDKPSGEQLTLELEVGNEVGVGRDGVDTPPLPQVPDVHRIIITTSSHMVPDGSRAQWSNQQWAQNWNWNQNGLRIRI